MMQLQILWALAIVPLAIASELLETAKEGGTLGGQALMFAGLIVLGWVVVALFKGLIKSMTEVVAASNAQRDEDRGHHKEIVEAFKSERASNIIERGQNFQTLLTISRDSAVAMTASAQATQSAVSVGSETASAIRDLSVAFREMKTAAHEDAMNPVERPVKVNQQS